MTTATITPQNLLGHPKGLFVCFMTEMWERFSFYGMKAILFLYLIKHHLFVQEEGYLLLGTYAGLAYALPLLGGMLADRYLGMRKAVLWGGLLLVLGQCGMAYTGTPATGSGGDIQQDVFAVQVMYFSLALIAMGVGFLKPNISTIVGRLYTENDPRRDSGFTIFYMGINLGAAISSLIVGYIGEKIGWGYGFGLSGVLMAVGLVNFVVGQKHFHGHAEPSDPVLLKQKTWVGLSREMLIYIGAAIGVVVVWKILQTKISFGALSALLGGHEATATEAVAVLLTLVLFVWLAWFVTTQCTPAQRHQMIVLMVLIAISALFWGLYEQTYGTWVAISDIAMNRSLWGFDWTAGQLTSIGAIFVIILSPVFAWLWPVLDKLNLNPSTPAKFGWGLVFAGLSMGLLLWATHCPAENGKVDVWWLVAAYFVLEVGEMVLSPIGLSAVTTLSVGRVVSLMMGAWFLFSAFGEMIAGRFGTLAAIDPLPDGTYDLVAALQVYGGVFQLLMWVGIVSGVGMLVATPLLKRGMHGVR